MVRVTVKWSKSTYEVDVDPSAPVTALKDKLYELTGVPVSGQKLMSKAWKGVLKDTQDLSTCGLADGAEVMLMGSSTGIPAPTAKVVFVEDMTTEDAVKAGAFLPAGLRNLGNTCYMNSTLQCLRAVPELRLSLDKDSNLRTSGGVPGSDGGVALTLKELFGMLDASAEPVYPFRFWQALKSRFAQFSETGPGGMPSQQDSEEFQSSLLTALSGSLSDPVLESSVPLLRGNAVDHLFGIEFATTLKCGECDEEPSVVQKELQRKLTCNIEGGAGSTLQVNHLATGIELSLSGTVEKQSAILGRNAVWTKSSRIARLPKYIAVQMLRFYWKPTPDSRDHAGVKCKMLRPVAFPADNFDVFDFCTPELQATLRVARDKASASLSASGGGGGGSAAATAAAGGAGAAMADDGDDGDLAAAIAMSTGAPAPASDDTVATLRAAGLSSDFRGTYELFAVVTHKGRSADAGHYIGWVRQKGDVWLCFDDDTVTECRTENILDLKGGGDYDMASMLFYRAKQ